MMESQSPPEEFPARINRRISIGIAVIVFLHLILGGISLYYAVRIYKINNAVSREYSYILSLNQIHTVFDDIFYEFEQIHDFRRFGRLPIIRRMLEDLGRRLEKIQDEVREEKYSPEDLQVPLGYLRTMVADMRELAENAAAAEKAGTRISDNDLERMNQVPHDVPRYIGDLGDVPRARIIQLLGENGEKITAIIGLYLAFLFVGCILIAAASVIFNRGITTPLRALVKAAHEIAEGRLGARVPVRSRTEIGQLSHSFNLMVENLEDRNRRLQDFQERLEQKVLERTHELEEASRHLLSAEEALSRSERAATIGQIAAGVTHEIRTPLSALAINLQLIWQMLDMDTFSREEARQLLSTADLEVSRINRTLEEFFRYARLPRPRFEAVQPNALIQQVANLLQGKVRDFGITLTIKQGLDLPTIWADADQLREVFLNLATNAIEAMPNGGDLSIVTQRDAGSDSAGVLVRVADSGTGIPPEILDRIFRPFFSTKDAGLGLGLSIVQRIVEVHGGRITCRSERGVGTTFDVYLRLTPIEPPVHEAHALALKD
jgi:signal transduction histidine kinase